MHDNVILLNICDQRTDMRTKLYRFDKSRA